MLENNPHLTSREFAEEFGIHHTTVGDHIKSLGFVLKQSVCVPHELTEKNLSDRVRMCSSHLIRHNVESFLNRLVTGDEKWILYENIKSKKSYCKPGISSATVPKPSIHERKVLFCLWWDRKGPVYYELLKQGKTINVDLYCNQLDKLNAAIKEKRPALASRKGIVFHHDNARPPTAMVTQQKLNTLGWEVLSHPRYSPDIAPSDYYLFRSRQNYLAGKKFKSFESVSKAVADYFNSKDENFYKTGFHRLPERWQQVVTNNGAYIID
ncbi:Mariner Mos1 transposase, partial [Stegodyphus mimosarum]